MGTPLAQDPATPPPAPVALPTWMLERPWRTSGNDRLDALMHFRNFYGTHAQWPGCHRLVEAADFPAHAGYAGTHTDAPCDALTALVEAYQECRA